MRSPLIATLLVAFTLGCSSDKSPDHAGGEAGMSMGGSVQTGGAGAGGSSAAAGTGGSMGGSAAGGDGGATAGGMSAGGAGATAGAGTAGAAGAAAGSGAGMSGASGMAGAAGASATGCVVPMSASDQPMLLSATGCVDPADPKKAAASLIAYDVNSPLWSDGATKERYVSLPAGGKIHVNDCATDTCMPVESGGSGEDDGHWDMPIGTVLMKVFIIGGKRIETRLITHRNASTWVGYSYEWNDDETDATLLPDTKDKPVGSQTWHYPSPSECLQCHTKAGGRSLGPTTAQMNRDYEYADGTMNQVDKFAALGLFDVTPPKIDGYPDPKGTGDLEARARSYLQANCSICHRPGGTVSDVDLRFVTPFKDTSLCNQMVNMGTGDPMVPQIRLTPGKPDESALSFRVHTTTSYRMPKIGSSVVDTDGVKVIDDWITSIQSCP